MVKDDVVDMDEYRKLVEDSEVLSQEEARAKISMILAKTERPEILSELHQGEDKYLAVLKTIADKYDSELLKMFISNFLAYRISLNREGRKEIIRVSQGSESERATIKKGIRSMLSMR